MGKTKRKQISNTQIEIVNKQTYLGIEMTSSGRYAYAREILSKKATKIVFTIKRLLSNIDSSARQGMNFSMPLLNLYYFMVVKYGE